MKYFSLITFCTVFLIFNNAQAADEIEIFNGKSLSGWQEKEFEGRSHYTLNGNNIKAHCNNGASSLYREIEINLDQTPILRWSWRADPTSNLGDVDERTKAGDDFAARIYAVIDTGLIIPNVLTLNYVWARGEDIGANWANPFYKKARMVVLNNQTQDGEWITQSRNLKDDFQDYFNKDIDKLDGIAIMTDCDNTGGQAAASYGRITLSPR